uniref:Uncharacterized protein n=1 Tax=Phaeomonas parva TaxID=124430 RepID=A0A7S1XMT3_9STRA|mmetsp:Transcript_17374/g.53161  ORF Transcript_17374/g.53161 Transcript_17374/m.53161 type:complete len:178 (+) Transcript_17374:146-679(+)|eukprot:CAMPEP_0118872602 /NCGR_PEP_ID=MMETSP1163-20130328/14733_1 /TAXON_ID=124430 /ORGANISM="Phaeomonas parva, Strain CCMP2877" /LENGTH=177 /DNA_ID=CAMNT_0006807805 /DNA_START=81 /DNA_END=614 /DNA_ORIENTATION=-
MPQAAMDEPPTKILIVGPERAGKTTIANFLTEQTQDLTPRQYTPTVGCRILETERVVFNTPVAVQIWDVSGSQSFENCWPAIMSDADGVVLVYNPGNPAHETEIVLWHDYFVSGQGVDHSRCLVYAHSGNEDGPDKRRPPPPRIEDITRLMTDSHSTAEIHRTFEDLLRGIVSRRGK